MTRPFAPLAVGQGRELTDRSWPELPDDTGTAARRVCIASPDIFGPVRNGGIGTQYRNLAFALVAAGHDVTMLFTQGERSEDGTFAEWVRWYSERGIRLVALPPTPMSLAGGPLTSAGRRSFEVLEWLHEQDPFDIVHAPDFVGLLYYPLLAKRCGLAFARTTFVTAPHSGAWWNHEGNVELADDYSQLLRIVREVRQVEMSDVVISSSQHMLRWLASHDVSLPEHSYVWPNAIGPVARTSGEDHVVDGIAFTGRLEPRKGLHLFLAALRHMPADVVTSVPIYLMGKRTNRFDVDSALDALVEDITGLEVPTVLTELNADEAMHFLIDRRLLAVMPSTLDNSPMMTSACLDWGVPFVTTDLGGTAEMITPESYPSSVVRGRPHELAAAILAALDGPSRPARRRIPSAAIDDRWAAWHGSVVLPDAAPEEWTPPPTADVVVCLVHHERPDEVTEALDAMAGQTIRPKEIVLVDNGSRSEAARTTLESLAAAGEVGGIPLRVEFQPNLYPGAARNLAVASTSSEFLLFVDDDNVAKPDMLETFLRAAHHEGGAGAYTCFFDRFVDGTDYRDPENLQRVLPAGDVGAIGIIENAYGDTNSLVRRAAFEAMGGFHEIWGVGREDHSFFAQMSIGGHGVVVVPRALFWYRRAETSISRRHFDKLAGPSVAAMHGAAAFSGLDRLLVEYGAARHLYEASVSAPQPASLVRTFEIVETEMGVLDREVALLRRLIARRAEG